APQPAQANPFASYSVESSTPVTTNATATNAITSAVPGAAANTATSTTISMSNGPAAATAVPPNLPTSFDNSVSQSPVLQRSAPQETVTQSSDSARQVVAEGPQFPLNFSNGLS